MNLSAKEKPILFNTEMVKAILDGRKTQTRRVLSQKVKDKIFKDGDINIYDGKILQHCMGQGDPDGSGGIEIDHWEEDITSLFSKYKVGDVLWVREPARVVNYDFPSIGDILNNEAKAKDWVMWYKYLADDKENEIVIPERFVYDCTIKAKWITDCNGVPNGCIKEMARIFLKVTDVRVEKLQDITFNEIRREGIFPLGDITEDSNNYISHIQELWINLWNSTAKNGYRWEDNPYVFVYEFERLNQ